MSYYLLLSPKTCEAFYDSFFITLAEELWWGRVGSIGWLLIDAIFDCGEICCCCCCWCMFVLLLLLELLFWLVLLAVDERIADELIDAAWFA